MRTRWPAAEAAQVDYETLREAALLGAPSIGPLAARFERGGLAAVIARPAAAAEFVAALQGGRRPAWTPYADPRLEVLADVYGLLLSTGDQRLSAHQGGLMRSMGGRP